MVHGLGVVEPVNVDAQSDPGVHAKAGPGAHGPVPIQEAVDVVHEMRPQFGLAGHTPNSSMVEQAEGAQGA